jgi:hypothetical protein
MRRTNKFAIPVLLLAGLAAVTVTALAKDPAPQAIHVREVSPAEGKAGDVLTAYGDCLNAERVLEVYLTNGFTDYKVEVLEQTEHSFTFRIPAAVPAGRYRVAVVGNESPSVLEQPAFVKVIEAKGPPTGE